MSAINDITGDPIQTRQITNKFRDNYDVIFRNKKPEAETPETPVDQSPIETNESNEN